MTVARLRQEMSAREFMQWQVWYGRKRQAEELAAKGANRGRR